MWFIEDETRKKRNKIMEGKAKTRSDTEQRDLTKKLTQRKEKGTTD